MNKKVSELAEATDVNNEDILMIIQNNENKQVTVDKLLNRQTAVTATMSDNQSITTTAAWQAVKVNLDTITSSDKLTLSGNAVKIGSGISKVLVSANTSFVEQTQRTCKYTI